MAAGWEGLADEINVLREKDEQVWELIGKLCNDLERYDKILFFESAELLQEFCQDGIMKSPGKTILILCREACSLREQNIIFRRISDFEAQQLTALYYTYDFSDKFLLVAEESTVYASLYNFVKTGILNIEEMVKALLEGW